LAERKESKNLLDGGGIVGKIRLRSSSRRFLDSDFPTTVGKPRSE
jgi:hypothetical protein